MNRIFSLWPEWHFSLLWRRIKWKCLHFQLYQQWEKVFQKGVFCCSKNGNSNTYKRRCFGATFRNFL